MIDLTAMRKAITWFESRYQGTTMRGAQEMHQTALACLRECAERREGREYCDEEHAEHDYMNGIQTFSNGTFLVLETTEWNDYYDGYNDVRISVQYCPKCGKPIGGGATYE